MRSKLELRGPREDSKFGPRSCRAGRSARLSTQMPNLPTKRPSERAGGASRGVRGVGGSSGRHS
eukprot:13943376-Alexandrium_andersonii.AAC.1